MFLSNFYLNIFLNIKGLSFFEFCMLILKYITSSGIEPGFSCIVNISNQIFICRNATINLFESYLNLNIYALYIFSKFKKNLLENNKKCCHFISDPGNIDHKEFKIHGAETSEAILKDPSQKR